MNSLASTEEATITLAELSETEIAEVSGAIIPLVVWGLCVVGGVAVGLGAAYIAKHW